MNRSVSVALVAAPAVAHLILALAMLALWIVRKSTGTWKCVRFQNDWDIAQKGAVLHAVGVITLWYSLLLDFCGQASEWPLWSSFCVGQIAMVLGFLAMIVSPIGTTEHIPAMAWLGRCTKAVVAGMITMAVVGYSWRGHDRIEISEASQWLFDIAVAVAVLGAIASFATVVWYSTAEHRTIRKVGVRAWQ